MTTLPASASALTPLYLCSGTATTTRSESAASAASTASAPGVTISMINALSAAGLEVAIFTR